jgi:hypothetical protein
MNVRGYVFFGTLAILIIFNRVAAAFLYLSIWLSEVFFLAIRGWALAGPSLPAVLAVSSGSCFSLFS